MSQGVHDLHGRRIFGVLSADYTTGQVIIRACLFLQMLLKTGKISG